MQRDVREGAERGSEVAGAERRERSRARDVRRAGAARRVQRGGIEGSSSSVGGGCGGGGGALGWARRIDAGRAFEQEHDGERRVGPPRPTRHRACTRNEAVP